jgi:glycerophosphoryl diester phosphodiesterase
LLPFAVCQPSPSGELISFSHQSVNSPQTKTRPWLETLRALRRAWKPLLAYELLMCLLAGVIITPVGLAIFYHVVGLIGDGALGNSELLAFLVSPLGIVVFVVGASVLLGFLFIEYSGLIVMADAALRGKVLSIKEVAEKTFSARPKLILLALVQTTLAIVVALPFLGLAALTYWWLLSDADINYYLELRPPKFWVAVAIGGVLAAACCISSVWFFLRWALAVPACVLDGLSWRAALGRSSIIMCGRGRQLLLIMGVWLLLKQLALAIALVGLDQANFKLTALFDGQVSLLVWSTLGLLLFDAAMLQLLGALFTITMAMIIACEYDSAIRSCPAPEIAVKPLPSTSPLRLPAWQKKTVIVLIAVVGPAISIASSLFLLQQFVDHRPTRVCAHRAGSSAAPENSLAALRNAIAVGADYVEIDVQQTADGHVVLMHDRDLRRVTGDPRNLNDVNLADLKPLRLRDRNGQSDEVIPTLAEFIDACGDRMRVNVELKTFGDGNKLALAVLEVLKERNFTERAVVTCFDMPPLREIKNADNGVPVGIILAKVQGDMTRLPVDILSLREQLVTGPVVRRAHRRNMEVFAWTVNDRERALRLLDLGCDNILTSDPAAMREIVDWYNDLGDTERMLLRIRRWMRE